MEFSPKDTRFWIYFFLSAFPFAIKDTLTLQSYLQERGYTVPPDYEKELTGTRTGAAWDGLLLDVQVHKDFLLSLEFQKEEIIYFFNKTYIANTGKEPVLSLLTWAEFKKVLTRTHKYSFVFWLLLPLVVATKAERAEVAALIEKALQTFSPAFLRETHIEAVCALLTLQVTSEKVAFLTHKELGTVCTRHASFRNVEHAGEEMVGKVNKLLAEICAK